MRRIHNFVSVLNVLVYVFMQVSPFVQLDLFHYACRDLLVSFAVSNVAGLSNFSSPQPVKVYGGN